MTGQRAHEETWRASSAPQCDFLGCDSQTNVVREHAAFVLSLRGLAEVGNEEGYRVAMFKSELAVHLQSKGSVVAFLRSVPLTYIDIALLITSKRKGVALPIADTVLEAAANAARTALSARDKLEMTPDE